MDTMKAVVYDRPGKFAVRQIALSEPGAGEVLLRVLVAGVCGTDLHLHHGEFGPTYPLIPGHEIVGEVVAAGPGVTDVRVGEQVTLDNTASCGRCVECRRARPAHCLHLVAQGVNAPGGFAEFVVTDADRCFNVDDLDPEVAVLAEPTACVVHGMDVWHCLPDPMCCCSVPVRPLPPRAHHQRLVRATVFLRPGPGIPAQRESRHHRNGDKPVHARRLRGGVNCRRRQLLRQGGDRVRRRLRVSLKRDERRFSVWTPRKEGGDDPADGAGHQSFLFLG